MSESNGKIVFAVGVTALFVSVVLIAGFFGYLYLRSQPDSTQVGKVPVTPVAKESVPSTPRPKGSTQVAAPEITKITFSESTMASMPALPSLGYFGNVSSTNFTSSSRILKFSVDGPAIKRSTVESTANGIKAAPRVESYVANVEAAQFADLTKSFADNDFANEPDSRDITSLPIRKILTISYTGGEKVVNTGHMGRNSIELTAMLNALNELDRKTAWKTADH